MSALEGIRVLDLSTSVAGAWCTRLLADFGADVISVERPEGSPLRRLAPLDGRGESIVGRYVLANRRSLTLEPGMADARASLLELAAGSDVVVESAGEGTVELWGLDVTDFEAARPGLIVAAITPNGATGPLSGTPGNDLTAYARSGWASVTGFADREPLKGSGFTASYIAGVAAYGAIVSALLQLGIDGAGQRIDVAEAEAMLSLFSPGMLRSQYFAMPWPRRPAVDVMNAFPVPVGDGHLSIQFARGPRFQETLLMLGLGELYDDERFTTLAAREQHRAEFSALIEERIRDRDRDELFAELSAMRAIAGPVLRVDDLADHEQLRARGYFVRPADATGGEEYPGAPFKMSRTPWAMRRSAPRVGEHTEEILNESRPKRPPTETTQADTPTDGGGPLAGLRAVVLTHAWVGTYCTHLLGLLGADVIQIEARSKPDSWRGGYEGVIPPALQSVETARRAWNCSPLYNGVNLNKRAITLDLGDPDGKELFERLVATADVVAENFSPRVMGQLGLDYDKLREIRPELVMVSMSGYGGSGPWRDILGIGGTVEPTSGMSSLLGYEGGPPMNSGQMFPDPVGGYYAFAAIVTALRHRARTGEGQYIDLSMQEANGTIIGDAMLQYLASGEVRPRLGNRHLTFAPHGIYPSAGHERWVAIAAESEQQWRAIRSIAGSAHWTSDTRFADNSGRKANEDALDEAIAGWTREHDRDELAGRLLAAGVPAAPVLDGLEVGNDATFRERGAVVDVQHPEAGLWRQAGVPFHFSRTPGRVRRPSPMLGEHSAEVLREVGVGTEQYADLVARGVTGAGPPE